MEDFKAYLSNHSKSLRQGYVWRTRLFLEWLGEFNVAPHEMQLSHLQGYIIHLQEEECKEYVVRLAIAALRNYSYMLVLNGTANEKLAMELYIKGVYKQPFPSLFEWEELKQMYQSFSTPGLVGQRNQPVFNLFLYQGLTPEEVINLTPKNLLLEQRTLTIPATYKTRERELTIEDHQVPLLDDYLHQVRPKLLLLAGKDDKKLFVTTSGNPNGKNITDNLLTSLKSKFPQITSYAQIRASVLHHWYTLYGLEETIKRAGHSYIQQTLRKSK